MSFSPLEASNPTYLWTQCIVEELVRTGVDTFFVAPGSRSTPLTIAVARHPDARVVVHVDERGTAFAALGYGRATGRPAGWITTSGTAVANGYPAVVEAAMDGVPLCCLTADRPPELRHSGANQTIDQQRIFGTYPKAFVDLPPPTTEMAVDAILPKIDETIYRATKRPSGPVHINAAFRKPLEPDAEDDLPVISPRLQRWSEEREPFNHRETPSLHLTSPVLDALAGTLREARRGLLVAGRLDRAADAEVVRALAGALGWPLIPDITSGLRLGPSSGETRIAHLDGVLAASDRREAWMPDAVLHVGGRAVSKRLRMLIRDACPDPYIIARPNAARFDPDHRATHHLEADVSGFCSALLKRLAGSKAAVSPDWVDAWGRAEDAVSAFLDRRLGSADPHESQTKEDATAEGSSSEGSSSEARRVAPSEQSNADTATEPILPDPILPEPLVSRAVTRHIPADHALVLASSMPVRDVNRFGALDGTRVPVYANRGASGIDGTIATAAGLAVGRDEPVTLVIGDLAALHDLNSLTLLQQVPVVVVLVNNQGGGIFHFLPIAEEADVFEPYFATPQTVEFRHASDAFRVPYARVDTPRAFVDAYVAAASAASAEGASAVIEVQTDREENHRVHDRLDAECAEAVRALNLSW